MKTNNPTNPIYVVRMFRKDGEVIDCFESEDFSKCKEQWVILHSLWQECHKEVKVFILERPVVTAFEPGLISEISVLPKEMVIQSLKDLDNPYVAQMRREGLVNTMKFASELNDGGYK